MSCSSHLLLRRCDIIHHGRRRLLLLLQSGPPPLRLRALGSRPPRISAGLRQSYRLLELPEGGGVSPAQVRESYLRLAKLYHPDAGGAAADSAAFARLEEAYRAVLDHQARTEPADGRRELEEEERPHGTTLAHRHYLSYEGLGLGTPGERERQFRQIRVDRASDRVLDYRQREHERAAAGEGALVERDLRQRSRKIKITQAVERLVEDLIQESVARGDFQNLSGAGKPLAKFLRDPYADPTTHNLNRILIDNGYQPPWVVAQRDIRQAAADVRRDLLEGRVRVGDPATPGESRRRAERRAAAEARLRKINKMVDDYNLIVPSINMQLVHFSLRREEERAVREAQREREGERERRKEEKKRSNAARIKERRRTGPDQNGLGSWIRNLFTRQNKQST